MGPAEISERFRQEIRKRADALAVGLGFDPVRRQLLRETKVNGLGNAPLAPAKFFFDASNLRPTLALLRQSFPEQVRAILRSAEKICLHRFDLLGYENLDFGRDIDWHLDPVHQKRAADDHWYTIKYLDFAAVGDAKIIWELNRHQHLVTLAKAYRLTDDPRFATELFAQWRHWQTHNPYPRGINWASSLEVAIRSLSWLRVYFLLDGTNVITSEFKNEWLRALGRNARHIERHLSTHFSPNTHLLGEAAALFFIGTLCPELRSAARWKQRGRELILQESERQIRPDGFHFEQSTYYHVYALDLFLHSKVLAALNDAPFPPEFDRRIEKMLEVLAVLCRAGAPPRWGDDDGGRLFDARRNRAEHLADPLATGAILFHRPDFKSIAGGLREETVWLLGEEGMKTFDELETGPPHMNSVAFPESGIYAMASSENRMQAIIDAGPHGAFRAGHGHADALSITVHADGFELLGDPGTFQYVGPENGRDQFRGTAAHNTLQLDGKSQSQPKGPFAWERLTKTTTEDWITGEHFDYFAGSHDGYSQGDHPVIHRRSVFFRKGQFWLVRDCVCGPGATTHKLDIHWHLHPRLNRSPDATDHYFSAANKVGLTILAPTIPGWSTTVDEDFYSPVYGAKEKSLTARFSTSTTLPAETVTLLVPANEIALPNGQKGTVSQMPVAPELSAYRFKNGDTDHHFLFSHGQTWTSDDWSTDAEFLYYSSFQSKLNLLILCNFGQFKLCDHMLLQSPQRIQRCEIFYSHGALLTRCSEPDVAISRDGQKALTKLFQEEESPRQVDR
jgi:hypothetical protein